MFHIVMVEPEIPQNTGNVARTCSVTGSALHLIRPLGFSVDDRHLKRAGLDYWHTLDISYKETAGLPKELLAKNADTAIRIPMGESQRSLNLSNSVAIVLYEALRQNNFLDLV